MIELGSATVTGTRITIAPPGKPAAMNSCRLTNLTPLALTVEGMGTSGSEQYLAPMQQAVFEIADGGKNAPRIGGIDLGGGGVLPTLLVEWSTNGDDDFPGSYPCPVTLPAAAPYLSARVLIIGNPSGQLQSYRIDPNPFRASITILSRATFNTVIQWSDGDGDEDYWQTCPTLLATESRTIETTGAIYLRVAPNSNDAEYVEWWETRYGPASSSSLGETDSV